MVSHSLRGRLLLLAPLLVFGLAGLGLYWRFLQPGSGPFHENLLPELIGFCFEGFVLVGLLSLVQAVRETDRRKQLWLSQRASLRDILSHLDLALLAPDAEPASTESLEQDPQRVVALAEGLSQHELELHHMVQLKRLATNAAPLSRDLIGVAAQLSSEHMRSWISITEQLGKIGGATDRSSLERACIDLLEGLKRFDALQR